MHFNIKEILTVTMILFAVIDIIGSIPVVIEVRRKVGHIHSEKATFVSFVLMMVFLFVGNSILDIIGIDVGSFAIAGSFILFFIALYYFVFYCVVYIIVLYDVLSCLALHCNMYCIILFITL